MTYFEAFEKIKASMKGAKTAGIDGHLAIQVNLSDSDASGIFYIEVSDGKLNVEPYDYVDNDAVFTVSTKDMIRLVTGKVTYEKAIESGALTVSGNLEKGALIRNLVVKAEKKAPAKKASAPKKTEKAPAKKPEVKSEPAKAAAVKTAATKVVAKETEKKPAVKKPVEKK